MWNSANFVFRADVMLEELSRFEPEIAAATSQAVAQAKMDFGFIVLDKASFEKAPKTSIDYAVMERTHRAAGACRIRSRTIVAATRRLRRLTRSG